MSIVSDAKSILRFTLSGLLILAAWGVLAQDEDAWAKAEAMQQSYIDAAQQGDTAAIAGLFADDAVLLPFTGGRFAGSEAIRGYYEEFGTGSDVEIEAAEVERLGDAVLDIGTFSLVPAEGQARVSGEYVALLREVDGDWRIARLVTFAPRGAME